MNKPINEMSLEQLAEFLEYPATDEGLRLVNYRLRTLHDLFRYKSVHEETPPINTELIVKAPDGTIHIASWRYSYSIFSCQTKSESYDGWTWKLIDPLKDNEL